MVHSDGMSHLDTTHKTFHFRDPNANPWCVVKDEKDNVVSNMNPTKGLAIFVNKL